MPRPSLRGQSALLVRRRRLVLLGAGGHASDVLTLLESDRSQRWRAVGAYADSPPEKDRLTGRGVPFRGTPESVDGLPPAVAYVAAVGTPAGRRHLVQRLARDRPAARLVHRNADVSPASTIGDGSVVMAGARVSAGVTLGSHVHVSYLAAVGHDSEVGDYVSVLPGAIISGGVRIDGGSTIGSAAFIREGVAVGRNAVVGAGAVVLQDVPADTVVIGVPAS